ncbi:MAG: nucleoside-diphosphate kinase [Elusimicrobia bacterium RIFCSPLOWO2_01_FULL_59_12]|nr:MAG: nucleoside-diphosphate kinase [Elusimicrobia bacterium RIFCSPLOWO2_01_FULL_59_12]
MAVERTCILVKPDGVCKGLTGTVLERFEKAGLRLSGLKMARLSRAGAERLYAQHKGKPFYDPLIHFMVSAPIVAAVWEGPGSIQKARALMGSTNSPEAPAGTLRRQHGIDNRHNLIHGSDSAASAEREIAFFFKPDELFAYASADWQSAELKGNEHGKSKKTSHSVPSR